MPGESTQVINKIKTFQPRTPRGRIVIWEDTTQNASPLSGGFDGVTGSVNGPSSSLVADLTYNATGPLILDAASGCPSGCLPYVQRTLVSVNGPTAWASSSSGIPGVALEDTLNNPLAFFPITSLQSTSVVDFPVAQLIWGYQVTVSSYAAATGVMTFPASTFINSSLVGVPAYVLSGTGAGQTFFISANTATTLTPTNGAFPTALDNTSVIQVCYWAATAGAGTTITASNGNFPTSPSLASGYSVVIVAGTGAGQVRAITSNTATAITVATWDTNPDNTSKFLITNTPKDRGAVDLSIAQQTASAGLNQGIQLAIIGTMSAGSPIRAQWEGYYAYP
jgi:hypothetical protein